ncbi:hypothetical protein PR048_019947 [Dryococelus australis]|uniref:Uncharacterized protein n=1 Tax=Dryococelus australis TaxID=614101 RepID=A0ABQ9H4Z9_9NEOP|nr:hypothetical protein PR048_019947 [Dryococelus australis]
MEHLGLLGHIRCQQDGVAGPDMTSCDNALRGSLNTSSPKRGTRLLRNSNKLFEMHLLPSHQPCYEGFYIVPGGE